MKHTSIIALTTITLSIGLARAGTYCLEQAGDCGTVVAAEMPEGGTCNGHSHDKLASVVSYDSNGMLFDVDKHVCHIGPC